MVALFAMICTSVNAQDDSSEAKAQDEFKVEFNVGTTTGDDLARDLFSTTVGVDFAYLTNVTKDLQLGGTVGVVNFFKNKSKGNFYSNHAMYISLGGSFRFYTDNDKFYLGSDAGYAIGLDDGGFYYRPRIGMVISDCSGINVSYAVANDAGEYSNVSLGYEITF